MLRLAGAGKNTKKRGNKEIWREHNYNSNPLQHHSQSYFFVKLLTIGSRGLYIHHTHNHDFISEQALDRGISFVSTKRLSINY